MTWLGTTMTSDKSSSVITVSSESSPKVAHLSNTFMHNTSNAHLYHVLSKYSRIDLNIKRVKNCLGTIGSSADESGSSADEPIVAR